jgi:two-component system, response regulator
MNEKTILLVEDNENDVFLTRRALNKMNMRHKLVIAQDGVEALEYLFGSDCNAEHGLPDIVLLDLKLPRIDGLQVLREIRSNNDTRYLPVMVVTSSSEGNDLVAADQLGATSYSVKPTHAREYADLIQALVNQCLNQCLK